MASMQTRTQPKEGFGQKVRMAAQVMGEMRGLYEVGKGIWGAGQAAAPYIRAGLALLEKTYYQLFIYIECLG